MNDFFRIYEPRTLHPIELEIISLADTAGVTDNSYRGGRRHITNFCGDAQINIEGVTLRVTGGSPTGNASQVFSDGYLEVRIIDKGKLSDKGKKLIEYIQSPNRDR